MEYNYNVHPIGVIHSCYLEKFGTPRQPGLVKSAEARLELLEPFNRQEMVKGLEEFSHIWIHFLFHDTIKQGWKATVRPPRLGGQQRVGVFASRSPHRPNFIGMSVVRLENVVWSKKKLFLKISGIDLLDQTPVLDIKPYVSYSDCIPEAKCSYTDISTPKLQVHFEKAVLSFCNDYKKRTGRDLKKLIEETLQEDPRPASQRNIRREFGVLLWDVNVRWSAEGVNFRVMGCEIIA